MADFLFWIAVACCAAAQGAIVRSTLRSRQVIEGDGSTVPRPRRGIEIAWTVIPALGLALVLALTWRAIHPAASAGASRAAVHVAPSRALAS